MTPYEALRRHAMSTEPPSARAPETAPAPEAGTDRPIPEETDPAVVADVAARLLAAAYSGGPLFV